MTVLAPERSRRHPAVRLPGSLLWRIGEAALLLAAPLLAVLVLHLRVMTNGALPDPAMHSVYLWDPGDLARRFAPAVLPVHLRNYIGPPAAYFRWGTRPGFLVPGRLAYLAFGPVPGFLVFRYLLALIAIVPAYILGKRCYGVGIGALTVCLVLASPVLVTAWGTDFPDSAAVSYVLGGLACLLLAAESTTTRRRWQLAAAVLLSAAVWSLTTTVLLIAVAVLVVSLRTAIERGRSALRNDLLWLAAGALATTIALGVGSWLVLGRADYVVPTLQADLFLTGPAQTALWHSSNWRWVLSDAYLLVLPATCLAWAILARRRRLPSPALAIGIIASLQLALACACQFVGSLQILEEHYISSPLWPASLLTLAVVIAELTRPLADRPLARWLPAALVVGVALVVESVPAVPALGWLPWGAGLAAFIVAVAWVSRRFGVRHPAVGMVGAAAILGAILVLTVAPKPASATLHDTAYDPPTGYAGALGGTWRVAAEDYTLEAAVRRAVPNASYRGEQLVDCLSRYSRFGTQLIGLFHTSINLLPGVCATAGPTDLTTIQSRDVAQLVAMSPNQRLNVHAILARLAGLQPHLVRFVTLRDGGQFVQVALIDFPAAAGPQHHP